MGAMHIRTDTKIRVIMQVKDGEVTKVIKTIRIMVGGIVKIACDSFGQLAYPESKKFVS